MYTPISKGFRPCPLLQLNFNKIKIRYFIENIVGNVVKQNTTPEKNQH